MTTTPAPQWRITWGEHVFTGEDLLAEDLGAVQFILGDGWDSCDPRNGPLHLMAIIAVYVARVTEATLDSVRVQIAASPAVELVGALGSTATKG